MGSDVSAVTNHFATANEGFNTTTSSTTNSGANTVALNSVTGLTNASIFIGVIEPGAAKEQVFTGVVDTGGSQITGVVWTKGTNVEHTLGVSVVDYDTGTGFNMLRKGVQVSLDQDGTLKAGAVDNAAALASNVVTTAKILDANVTTAKIADDNVTDSKLIYGKLRSRQGGSATNWSTSGTTTYDYSGTDVFMQTGTKTITTDNFVITFPTAFAQVPIVIVTNASASSSNTWAELIATTATTFTVRCIDETGTVRTTEQVNWLAIGQ